MEDLFCEQCERPLLSQKAIIEKLLLRQSELEERHNRELSSLKDQLSFMQASFGEEEMETHEVSNEQKPEPKQFDEPDFDKTQIIISAISEQQESIGDNREQKGVNLPKKREPSALAVFFHEFLLPLTDVLELIIGDAYLQNYLNEFCYKFNRRYFESIFDRVIIAAVSCPWKNNMQTIG